MFFRTNIEDHPPILLRILNFFEIFCGLGLQGNSETVLYIAPGDRRPFSPFVFVARSRSHGPPCLTQCASEPPRPPPPLPAGPERGRGGNRTVTQMRLNRLD